MLRIYHSNQLEILKELIATLIEREPLTNPFTREVVLVQSHGMEQWLQIQLAQRFGIAANIKFPLPASFIWQMFTYVLPDIPQESAFSKEAMTWKLMALLPSMLSAPEFTALNGYLVDDGDRRKHYQLASRIADLFDQYLVYRPDWLDAWNKEQLVAELDSAQLWQAPLWRALTTYTESLDQLGWHRANLYQRFIQTLNSGKADLAKLPKRIFICGISALPPIYLQALQALGQHIEIHLMFTNPCREYWGDIQDYAFLAKLQSRQRHNFAQTFQRPLVTDAENVRSLFDEQGEPVKNNPLLASWGKLGRDNMYLLADLDNILEVEAFVAIESDTLLHRIQRDILELDDFAQIGETPETFLTSINKRPLAREDRSINLNACHSPLREVEVLHDYLLTLLDADLTLTPRDIIVMVADIDSYTPYIQAVFGNAPTDRYLPFAISDRRVREAHPILPAFITLLDLPQSRFSAEDVLALLEVPSLALRFGINEVWLPTLRKWVEEAQIRWGLDDDSWRSRDLPVTGQNTWRFGLERMLLGYTMESQSGDWQGVLPYDESSGLIAELVGQLGELLNQLTEWRSILIDTYRLEEWLPLCQKMLAAFFISDSETEPVLGLIEQQWQQLIAFGVGARYDEQVPLTILRDELAARLDNERISQRFLAGSINFCTLMPMRSIPFKAVCLLGMNDGVYPRTIPPLGFDLMADKPLRGDRSRRDDDRYLFLEALLSAQQQFYISYIGRSIQDNTLHYPSVLVSELLDYVAQSHCLAGDEQLDVDASAQAVREHLLNQHPRLPFSKESFMADSALQSYAKEWLPAARRGGEWAGDFSQRLSPLSFTALEFDQLQRFYRHPVRGFFQQRLQVHFSLQDVELVDEEPFVLDSLQRYQMNSRLLKGLIDGQESEQLFNQMRTAGELPYAAFGELFWLKQQQEMVELAERVLMEKRPARSDEIALEIEDIHLYGWLNQVQDDGLLRWRPAVLSAVDGMTLWLEHLVYCCSAGRHESRMFGRKVRNKWSEWRFQPLSAELAEQELSHFLAGYRDGMCEPLLLFPKSGWAWLQSCYNQKTGQIAWDETTQEKAKQQFIKEWQGNQQVSGERRDPYFMRLVPVLDEIHFQRILQASERYLLPLMRYRLVEE